MSFKRTGHGVKNAVVHSDSPQKNSPSSKARSTKGTVRTGFTGYQRQQSYDRVRKIVLEEGRSARNLLTWSVPVESEIETSHNEVNQDKTGHRHSKRHQRIRSASRSASSENMHAKNSVRSEDGPGQLNQSGLSGSSNSKKGDLRARYWAFLFENLRRAVDEIYNTCEEDDSVVECKEVIMMLEQCTKDFKSLIQRMELLRAFEKADKNERPTSLAWEVRKMSPGKSLSSSTSKERISPSPTISRSLNFGQETQQQRVASWADKVKGYIAQSVSTADSNVVEHVPASSGEAVEREIIVELPHHNEINEEIENSEGWETVHRSWRMKRTLSGSSRSSGGNSQGKKSTQKPVINKNDWNKNTQATVERQNNRYQSNQNNEKVTCNSNKKTGGNILKSNKENVNKKVCSDDIVENKGDKSKSGKSYSEIVALSKTKHPDQIAKNGTTAEPEFNHCKELKDISKNTENIKKPIENSKEPIQHIENSGYVQNDLLSGKEAFVENAKGSVTSDIMGVESQMYEKPFSEIEAECSGDGKSSNNTEFESAKDEEISEIENLKDEVGSNKTVVEEDLLASELESALRVVLDEEDALEQENAAALAEAAAEEQTYLREIAREQSTDITVMDDDDDDDDDNEEISQKALETSDEQGPLDWDTILQQHDAECASGLSWGDMVEEEDQEAAAAARTPGRVVIIHEKLSSPSRKRSPTESRKRHEEKQAKAQELRLKLMAEKADRVRTLSKKVEEVREYKNELLEQKRLMMERKLMRAEAKRQEILQSKMKKAHEEETKANEIAFISMLEAQNKRHDIIVKHQESEARLQDIQEERQRKVEEKAAKEAAVEERRRALEADRQARLLDMQEKRKERQKEFEARQQEKEKERLETARARERDREERIAALTRRQQQNIEVLQRKIKQKQDESDKRHKENLKQIREKAFEMSIMRHEDDDLEAPTHTPYDNKKLCTVCNVMIPSEVYLLSHLTGKKHQQAIRESSAGKELSKKEIEEFNLKHIYDAPTVEGPDPRASQDRERQKALRKRCKKLRQRMNQRGQEYESSLAAKSVTAESPHRAKFQKIVKDVSKYLQSQDKGPWSQGKVSALERALGEISRIMEKKAGAGVCEAAASAWRACGGLTMLSRLLLLIQDSQPDLPTVIPARSLVMACNVFRLTCKGCYDNCHYMLFSNKVGSLVDLLVHRLNDLIPADIAASQLLGSSGGRLPHDPVACALLHLLSSILAHLAQHSPEPPTAAAASQDTFISRANDIVSYITAVGVVDKLCQLFSLVRGPLDTAAGDAPELLQHALAVLSAVCNILTRSRRSAVFGAAADDPTQLVATLRSTELVGIVSLMYGLLLHAGAPPRGSGAPPPLPTHTAAVLTAGFRMLNSLAVLNLPLLQTCLGAEGVSLELRHITSYLLWYCSHQVAAAEGDADRHHGNDDELLHEVILTIGYFTVLHPDNQSLIESGPPPTVLQQLCALPFAYFSAPALTAVLLPTLVAATFRSQHNFTILSHDVSPQLLANFIEEKSLESPQASSPRISSKPTATGAVGRLELAARFPREEWAAATHFFSHAAGSTDHSQM